MTNNQENINNESLNKKIKQDKNFLLIDVRSLDEHLSETINGAVCIPHDEILNHLDKLPKDKEIVLFCRSGNRSGKALDCLKEKGYCNLKNLEGGMLAWNQKGLPVFKKRKAIPIQRQVMIGAGSIISFGALMGHFVNYNFWALTAFVGLGLLIAGLTGFCGMALLLEKMPWNKNQ